MKSNSIYKYLFWLIILLNIIIFPFYYLSINKNNSQLKKPFAEKSYNSKSHFCEKNLIFEGLEIDSNDVVITGDSFIDNFPVMEMFNSLNLKNRGIQGEFTEGLIELIPIITNGHPKKIFIYIGINDIIFNVSKEKTIDNFKKIIEQIQTLSPNTSLYFISILPMRKNSSYCIDCNDEIISLNKEIEILTKDRNVVYLSIFKNFIKNGQLDNDLVINDGLHLNWLGYTKFKQCIQDYIN